MCESFVSAFDAAELWIRRLMWGDVYCVWCAFHSNKSWAIFVVRQSRNCVFPASVKWASVSVYTHSLFIGHSAEIHRIQRQLVVRKRFGTGIRYDVRMRSTLCDKQLASNRFFPGAEHLHLRTNCLFGICMQAMIPCQRVYLYWQRGESTLFEPIEPNGSRLLCTSKDIYAFSSHARWPA